MSDPVKSILERAEDEIRAILAEAARSADVAQISKLTKIIEVLHRMVEEADGKFYYDSLDFGDAYVLKEAPPKAAPPQMKPRSRGSKKHTYPQFHWEDDGQTLVKTGWSRKKRKEYRHRAPKKVLDQVQKKLEKLGAGDKLFTMEDVLPIMDPDTDKEISSYQIYLYVAYLQQQGKITRTRDGLKLQP
jgi:hypothetical protein